MKGDNLRHTLALPVQVRGREREWEGWMEDYLPNDSSYEPDPGDSGGEGGRPASRRGSPTEELAQQFLGRHHRSWGRGGGDGRRKGPVRKDPPLIPDPHAANHAKDFQRYKARWEGEHKGKVQGAVDVIREGPLEGVLDTSTDSETDGGSETDELAEASLLVAQVGQLPATRHAQARPVTLPYGLTWPLQPEEEGEEAERERRVALRAEITGELHRLSSTGTPSTPALRKRQRELRRARTSLLGIRPRRRQGGAGVAGPHQLSPGCGGGVPPARGGEGVLRAEFEAFRQAFFQRHFGELVRLWAGLPRLRSIEPAPVSLAVIQSFFKGREEWPDGAMRIGFHATRLAVMPNICAAGFLLPGRSGVHVHNGTAMGVGVYTASTPQRSMKYIKDRTQYMFLCSVIHTPDEVATRVKGTATLSASPTMVTPLFVLGWNTDGMGFERAASGLLAGSGREARATNALRPCPHLHQWLIRAAGEGGDRQRRWRRRQRGESRRRAAIDAQGWRRWKREHIGQSLSS